MRSTRSRLLKITQLLHAIDAGELLAAFPDCPIAFEDHKAALKLLAIIEMEAQAAYSELDAAQDLPSRKWQR